METFEGGLIMKMFLGDRESNADREIDAAELKAVFDNLKGDPDGGRF